MHKEKLLVINEHFQLQYEEAQECFVLLYPEGMVQLNQSAGEIMNLCDGTNTSIDITNILEKKFNIKDLQKDVVAFLEEAINRKWVFYGN
ncbi:pyrroloquinoline quinone biosynthesis peptide chaperone PqqD [Halarcobacter mediterraneus]|uniref:Pyrroloquinoline quinone biosynthesis peptide chaperone PqqD n=1 Tax=Halarcobacter mediterraneus TaxID=2023153 RepID=A0A4Q1B4L7_9BACT|nr:pyrroloquinoline quinone biosynthesis peptide chaperone PqqD [Halarcobacter mediterraneus]RXK13177.1 pyrroloquinoline quinone biosynthesis peptide chaperone PqqD [Halarcobacter mediterraneus]